MNYRDREQGSPVIIVSPKIKCIVRQRVPYCDIVKATFTVGDIRLAKIDVSMNTTVLPARRDITPEYYV